jgi:hypothetical protein
MWLAERIQNSRSRRPQLEGSTKAYQQMVRSFNQERPHEAFYMKSPDQIYVLSELKYHGVKALQYSPEFEVRLVNSKGDIQWLSHRRFIGEAFKGQYLGLRRYDEEAHEVYLDELLLGHLPDAHFCAFRP